MNQTIVTSATPRLPLSALREPTTGSLQETEIYVRLEGAAVQARREYWLAGPFATYDLWRTALVSRATRDGSAAPVNLSEPSEDNFSRRKRSSPSSEYS
jgi:hypothetical protein